MAHADASCFVPSSGQPSLVREAVHPLYRETCGRCLHHPNGGSCARCKAIGFDCACSCPRPNPRNSTAIIVTLARPNSLKLQLLEALVTSALGLTTVVLLDQALVGSGAEMVGKTTAKLAHLPRLHVVSSPSSRQAALAMHGPAAETLNACCPGKLRAVSWCAASGFAYCWHVEDDVLLR